MSGGGSGVARIRERDYNISSRLQRVLTGCCPLAHHDVPPRCVRDLLSLRFLNVYQPQVLAHSDMVGMSREMEPDSTQEVVRA